MHSGVMGLKKTVFPIILVVILPFLSACSAIISSATGRLADNLAQAILDSNDPDTVRQGVPAYLILIDALLQTAPDNTRMLQAAATLYGAYGGGFVTDPERARRLSSKALQYAIQALCRSDEKACAIRTIALDDFRAWLATKRESDIELLYAVGVAWAGWVQARSDDWNAIADLARVRMLMERVLQFDEAMDDGGPHLYLAVFDTLLPATLGGRPEEGRAHFERAIELSAGRYLMAKVFYARQYARLVYDRELHDRLLHEVLASEPVSKGRTLVNLIAQDQARALLASAEEHF